MPEEPTFLDLVSILSITPDTTIERFSSTINASIFDAANITGTLKQKGLIDFSSNYPGPNPMMLTEAAKSFITEADAKAAEPFDKLDETILLQLSGGNRSPEELQATFNLRPKDLAMHLYKVYKQGLIIYELKSGNVSMLLTEKGFLKANEKAQAKPQAPVTPTTAPTPQKATAPGPAQATSAKATAQQVMHPQQTETHQTAGQQPASATTPPAEVKRYGKPMNKRLIMAGIIIVALIAVLALYHKKLGI